MRAGKSIICWYKGIILLLIVILRIFTYNFYSIGIHYT